MKLNRLPAYIVCLLVVALFGADANANDEKTCIAYLAYDGEYWQAWVISPDGKRHKQITRTPYEKNRVSWYPDGKHLLVSGNQGGIYKVDLVTGKESKTKTKLDGMNDAAISADGKYIAFSLSTSGSRDDHNIWIVNSDGSNHRKLTNMKRMQHTPVWHPDGEWIYFHSNVDGQSHDIWRVSLNGKKKQQITGGQLYNFAVAVNDKGELAFSSNRSGNYVIWYQQPEKEPVAITDGPYRENNPSWSPSGELLTYESTKSGKLDLWVMEGTGKNKTQLTHSKLGARAPAWGPQIKGAKVCQ